MYTFDLDQNFEELTLKVYATLKDSSERLVVTFKYAVKSNLIQLFDQKDHIVQLKDKKCGIGLKLQWLHNPDLLKYDQCKAEV